MKTKIIEAIQYNKKDLWEEIPKSSQVVIAYLFVLIISGFSITENSVIIKDTPSTSKQAPSKVTINKKIIRLFCFALNNILNFLISSHIYILIQKIKSQHYKIISTYQLRQYVANLKVV